MSKNSTQKKDFYFPIISILKTSTNLTKIQEELDISKQQLNYYLRQLVQKGLISKKGRGWYEVTNKSKNSTQYDINLKKDMSRGHAYIWKAKITKIPEKWDKRIEILQKNNINYKLVGAMKNIPRIKVYGRKVWLCNNYIKVWETKSKSYYGENAIESKNKAFDEIKIILKALENKLNINLRPYLIDVRREHYALIKNDLAIYHNKRGEIVRIKDKDGEWLLIDDSLEMGGELETIGKKALPTNIILQKWWNDHKKNKFQVTPTFLMESINQVTNNQLMFAQNISLHQSVLEEIRDAIKELKEERLTKKG